jgi:fumarylacetoacetate (FAA) hydrolase
MKLATINDGSRDGQLAVVARDLKTAHLADGIAPTLQAALDDWPFISPQLDAIYQQLNQGRGHRSFEFAAENCLAPLPRVYQRAVAAAYLHHVQLLHKAAREDMPESLRDEPLLYQASGDDLLGACEAISVAHEEWGVDFEASLAAITDDIAVGATPDQALPGIRLLMLSNEVALRNLIPAEMARGFGFLASRPAPAFSPVAITPDELGDCWKGGKVHLPLRATLNGKLAGQPQAGVDMAFNFPQLLSHLARSRRLRPGSIVATGAVSNKDAGRGYASIAEKRCLEIIAKGEAQTPFMRFGDTIRIEMLDADGKSLFGAIEQTLTQTATQAAPRKGR